MVSKADYRAGNRLTLLESGREYFPALLAEIATARQEIFLESYIFAADPAGEAIAAALIDAAARGVRVQVLVDGFGGRNFPQDFLPRFASAGVYALLYRPELARFNFRRHRLRRLHRKLAVIDARVAFVGGINVVDDDNAPPAMRPRYDYAVRLEGPVVAQVHAAVARMWEIVVWASFKRRYRIRSLTPPECPETEGQIAAFLRRDSFRHRNDILNAYLAAIASARTEVLIANAYFLPGFRFRHALRAAARRGVAVTILLQGVSDHPLLQYASRTLYASLLADGIRIFEYRRSFLHAKVAVVDGRWATVGSSNIDPFSLFLAKEGNLAVRDRDFALELRGRLDAAMASGAVEILPGDLARLPWHSRLLRWISYGAVRALVGLAGFGPRLWRREDSRLKP